MTLRVQEFKSPLILDIPHPLVLLHQKVKTDYVQLLAKNISYCCVTNEPWSYWLKITVVYYWSGFHGVHGPLSPGSCDYTQLEGRWTWQWRWPRSRPGSVSIPRVAPHIASFPGCLRGWPPTASFCHALLATAVDQSGLEARFKTTLQRGLHTLWEDLRSLNNLHFKAL